MHNFYLSVVMSLSTVLWIILCRKIHPLIILRGRGIVLLVLTLLLPFSVDYASSNIQIFLIQASLLVFSMVAEPAGAVFITHFPVLRRFTIASFVYALSRAVMYVITSFSLVYLTEWFGYYGIWAISFPIIFCFLWGINYFAKLEKIKNIMPSNLSAWQKFTSKKAA
ncbi:MAG: hypothetical protein NT128_00910 [Proteobacteria bacterium]|nr:hypothetical protein [Pseudomonadota bacterium]